MKDYEPLHPSRWGADHLSTLLYIETRIVDQKGTIKIENMRCNPRGRHSQFAHMASLHGEPSPTQLAGGKKLAGHDDWDCVEDFIAAELLLWQGTGAQPVMVFTDLGWAVSTVCRRARGMGSPRSMIAGFLRLASDPGRLAGPAQAFGKAIGEILEHVAKEKP